MDKFSVRQVCFFFIAFTPVTKIIILPSLLSSLASGDLWISMVISGFLDLITLFAIIKLLRLFPKKSFYDILTLSVGNIGTKIIFFIYALLFLIKAFLPIVEQRNFVEQSLYDTSYSIFTFFPFFIVSIYLCMRKKVVLGRLADACFLITVISMAIIFSLSFSNANLSNILPIGVSKLGFIKGAYSGFTWFGDAVYLLFFIEKIEKEKFTTTKIVICYLVALVLVVFFGILFYATFSFIAQRQNFALIEISKYSAIISITGRFDYIAIFGVLFTSVPALILPLYFSCYALRKVFGFKNRLIPSLIVNGVMILSIFIFNKSYLGLQNFLIRYFGIIYFIFFNLIPILTLLIKEGKSYDEKKTIKI